MRLPVLALAAALVFTGCDSTDAPSSEEPVERASLVPDARKTPSLEVAPPAEAELAESRARDFTRNTTDATDAASSAAAAQARLRRGIDVSHHQGDIDWTLVAGDRVEFAWIKATEGSTFTDPRFTTNREAARASGLRVGAYHYFSICRDGGPQAQHFLDVVGDISGRNNLPPAVDVELDPACTPTRDELVSRVSDFIEAVEESTGRSVVVYAFPDLEKQYELTKALDRPTWVRRLGHKQPVGDWLVWQKSQSASIAGIDGPVDLNLMRS